LRGKAHYPSFKKNASTRCIHTRTHSDTQTNATQICSLDSFAHALALALGSLGAVYLVLGLLCFRQLRQRQLTTIRRRKQMLLQAQHLSQHKHEIEQLLKETESKMQNSFL